MKYTLTIAVSISLYTLTPFGALAQSVGTSEFPTIQPFLWVQTSFIHDETPGKHSTFQLKRTRLGTKGMVHQKIGYHIMMEGVLSGKDPKVIQAWIDYRLHPFANVRFGQFKYPFGIEAYPSFTTWKFINPSFVTGGLVKELGRVNSGQASGFYRDIGVQTDGKFKINSSYTVGYKVMVMNGNGILKTDDNGNKDVVLQANLKAPVGFQIGFSYFKGSFENAGGGMALDESAVGVDLLWNYKVRDKAYRIQGEYIVGNYKTTGKAIKPQGFYLFGTLFALPNLEVGMRYDWFEPNENAVQSTERERTTLGGAYHIHKSQQIKLNYEIINDDLRRSDNLFTAQFQVAF